MKFARNHNVHSAAPTAQPAGTSPGEHCCSTAANTSQREHCCTPAASRRRTSSQYTLLTKRRPLRHCSCTKTKFTTSQHTAAAQGRSARQSTKEHLHKKVQEQTKRHLHDRNGDETPGTPGSRTPQQRCRTRSPSPSAVKDEGADEGVNDALQSGCHQGGHCLWSGWRRRQY